MHIIKFKQMKHHMLKLCLVFQVVLCAILKKNIVENCVERIGSTNFEADYQHLITSTDT